MNKEIIINNNKYIFIYYYGVIDNFDLISMIDCYKMINNKRIHFGKAFYQPGYKMVKCIIEYNDYINNPNINIDKDKEEFTEVLNIAKKEILKHNNGE